MPSLIPLWKATMALLPNARRRRSQERSMTIFLILRRYMWAGNSSVGISDAKMDLTFAA